MQLFSGVALGAVLIMAALGLSIIFGMLGVVNFAHGALFMVGAYAGLYVGRSWTGAAYLVGIAGRARRRSASSAWLIERFLIRPAVPDAGPTTRCC